MLALYCWSEVTVGETVVVSALIKQWLHTIIVVTVFFCFSLSYCCSITVVPIFPHYSPLPCPHPHIDLAYKWNLVSKTNKQAKQNQRRGNKEQIDSNQRGREGNNRGNKGEGSSRNMYEGTLDKAKGDRLKGGRGGGGGDK